MAAGQQACIADPLAEIAGAAKNEQGHVGRGGPKTLDVAAIEECGRVEPLAPRPVRDDRRVVFVGQFRSMSEQHGGVDVKA